MEIDFIYWPQEVNLFRPTFTPTFWGRCYLPPRCLYSKYSHNFIVVLFLSMFPLVDRWVFLVLIYWIEFGTGLSFQGYFILSLFYEQWLETSRIPYFNRCCLSIGWFLFGRILLMGVIECFWRFNDD